MLIRKIKKIRKIKFPKKERSWGTKFGNLAIFLPINTSLYSTHKGEGNFAQFEEPQKTLNHKKNPKPKPIYRGATILPLDQKKPQLPLRFSFFWKQSRRPPGSLVVALPEQSKGPPAISALRLLSSLIWLLSFHPHRPHFFSSSSKPQQP